MGPERTWWDLLHYDLSIEVFPDKKSIKGKNKVRFRVIKPHSKMQIDLQTPLEITSVRHEGLPVTFEREGNVYWLTFDKPLAQGKDTIVEIAYEGVPVESKNPPWSGGITWTKDKQGEHFIATSCQGIGASIWWPCKDHGEDEPDQGMNLHFTVPDSLVAVGNGRLIDTTNHPESKTRTFHWSVKNPINNYAVNMNIGNYTSFKDQFVGEGGKLDVQYWMLKHQRDRALTQFKEAPRTLKAFEHWFGKYPFYEDGYKLVVVPYLGMEHQSSVTYGNGFQNGYRGTDLSGTGVGMKFDFIIVHESGHEWFGNNISMKDTADMWIHESFTNYSENLFVEYHFSKEEAEDYVIGCRKRIQNDIPIIGKYGLNQSGSGDMYYKGGNMLHTLRHIVNDDAKWRRILRGINRKFWHQTVTTEQVEDYLSSATGVELKTFFDQYLRTTKIPVFEYSISNDKTLNFRFINGVDDLSFPLKVVVNDAPAWLTPTDQIQSKTFDVPIDTVTVDRNFYVDIFQTKPK